MGAICRESSVDYDPVPDVGEYGLDGSTAHT